MKTQELFNADGKSANVWYCGECRVVHKEKTKADKCCEPWLCKTCGKDAGQYRIKCSACTRAEYDQRDRERLEEAAIVEDYDGWVFALEGYGNQDGYFPSVEELIDCYWDAGDAGFPSHVFACKSRVLKADVCDVLEQLDCNGYEEMTEHACGIEDLSKAIDTFNEANKEVFTVWEADYTRKVAVPRPESEAE